MTTPSIAYVLARDCFKSPDNVRTHSDPSADAELKANIAASGFLLENLIGVRVSRGARKGQVEIYGGGRRLEATRANIDEGALHPDFMVPVLIAKNARDAIEMSLAENFYQLPMNPADECCAFRMIIEREKKSPAEVAKRFGKTETFVLGRLRLANLADPVFAALRALEITIDVAKAYGSTADKERQARVFEQVQASYHRNNPNEIRRLLATGSFCGADPKAMLVGRDAYIAAGGRIEEDLFTDAGSEIWRDGEIVERLAQEALETAAQAIRAREGFAEVRVVPATMIPYSMTYQLPRAIEPEPGPLSPDAAERQVEIEAELATIEEAAQGADDYSPEQVERIEALHAELDAMMPQEAALTPAQKAGAIAFVMIDADGKPRLHDSFYALEDLSAEDGGLDDDDMTDEAGEDDAGGRDPGAGDEEGEADGAIAYSGRLRDELAVMKTELLALHVANDPQFALNLAIFIMVDKALGTGWTGMPSELSARSATARVHGYESDTAAARGWTQFEQGLERAWHDHDTIEARYDAFCALDDAARAAWLGWAVARTINAVPDGHSGSSFLTHLGAKLGIDAVRWWRPTARNFFDRLTKPMILGLLELIGGLALKSRYASSRKFDLAVSAEKLFAGDVIADADVKARALSWLPDEMRFGPDAGPPSDDALIGGFDDERAREPEAAAQSGDDAASPAIPQAA